MKQAVFALRAAMPIGMLVLAGTSGAALASEPRLGSAAFQSVRLCGGLADEVDCDSPANPDFSRKETFTPGGERVDIDSVYTPRVENGGGLIISRVKSVGALDLPEIKSGVWAGDNNRLSSGIAVYGGLTMTGTDPLPFALDVLIDWTGSGAPRALADLEAGLPLPLGEYGGEGTGGANLLLMEAAYVPEFANGMEIALFSPGKGCGSAGVVAASGIRLISGTAGSAEASFTLGNDCSGAPILLQPGQTYVLFTTMQTVANRFGVFDATNTIRVVLSDSLSEEVQQQLAREVVTARSLVPEPASWAMMIAGFGLVGAVARRQRRSFADASRRGRGLPQG